MIKDSWGREVTDETIDIAERDARNATQGFAGLDWSYEEPKSLRLFWVKTIENGIEEVELACKCHGIENGHWENAFTERWITPIAWIELEQPTTDCWNSRMRIIDGEAKILD